MKILAFRKIASLNSSKSFPTFLIRNRSLCVYCMQVRGRRQVEKPSLASTAFTCLHLYIFGIYLVHVQVEAFLPVEKPSFAFTTFTCLHLYIFGACTSEGISTSRNTFTCTLSRLKMVAVFSDTHTAQKFWWKLEMFTAVVLNSSQGTRKNMNFLSRNEEFLRNLPA